MEANASAHFETALETAISLPGVKVDRTKFLTSIFKKESEEKIQNILEKGPTAAGCSREELKKIVRNLVNTRTLESSGLSFAAGLPGGIAMAGTITADAVQFFGIALHMAQEISYLYGADDLWDNDTLNDEKVENQLVLYMGVMFGASGSTATVKVLASKLSQQAMKKLPQKALTKTLIYPIVKQIAKFIGVKMTKDVFAKGVSKAVPVVGGVVSGGITYATMKPMGRRLARTLDEAAFGYSADERRKDIEIVADTAVKGEATDTLSDEEIQVNKLKKFKDLADAGIISEEDFQKIKDSYISKFTSGEEN